MMLSLCGFSVEELMLLRSVMDKIDARNIGELEDYINGRTSLQSRWLEHGLRVGNKELVKKIQWLNAHNIHLKEWQLWKFTGYDRGIGKTYVSMLTQIYSGSRFPTDPDLTTERRKRDYHYRLEKLKEEILTPVQHSDKEAELIHEAKGLMDKAIAILSKFN